MKVHPDRGMTLEVNGELWVPVEITLIGKTGFMEAWRKGVEEWAAMMRAPEKRAFYVTQEGAGAVSPRGAEGGRPGAAVRAARTHSSRGSGRTETS